MIKANDVKICRGPFHTPDGDNSWTEKQKIRRETLCFLLRAWASSSSCCRTLTRIDSWLLRNDRLSISCSNFLIARSFSFSSFWKQSHRANAVLMTHFCVGVLTESVSSSTYQSTGFNSVIIILTILTVSHNGLSDSAVLSTMFSCCQNEFSL